MLLFIVGICVSVHLKNMASRFNYDYHFQLNITVFNISLLHMAIYINLKSNLFCAKFTKCSLSIRTFTDNSFNQHYCCLIILQMRS